MLVIYMVDLQNVLVPDIVLDPIDINFIAHSILVRLKCFETYNSLIKKPQS